MITKNNASFFYDALLSVPGMNEIVKIDLKVSRKQILLLCQVIEQGLNAQDGMVRDLLGVLPKESRDELVQLAGLFLEKSGLAELEGKLKAFAEKLKPDH